MINKNTVNQSVNNLFSSGQTVKSLDLGGQLLFLVPNRG